MPWLTTRGDGPLAFNHFRPIFVYQYVKVPLVTAEQVHKVGLLYARSAMGARR